MMPANYVCSKCKRTNLRLYRDYNSFNVELCCFDCAEKEGKWSDEKRFELLKNIDGGQLASRVAAFPCLDSKDAYWGYSSAP